jgi:hypothetical protein
VPPEKKNEAYFMVDVDVHIKESPAAMAPYCDMPWRRALEAQKDAPLPYLAPPYLPVLATLAVHWHSRGFSGCVQSIFGSFEQSIGWKMAITGENEPRREN